MEAKQLADKAKECVDFLKEMGHAVSDYQVDSFNGATHILNLHLTVRLRQSNMSVETITFYFRFTEGVISGMDRKTSA